MKNFSEKINKIKLTTKTTPTFLLFIAILVYGLFFWQRGFYWDEFPWMWTYFQLGSEMLTKTFSTSRPFWGMIYQITMPIIGANPWAWQLLAILLRWLTAFLLWKILCTLYPKHEKQNLWGSLFFLVYPGMGQHFIAFMYSHFYIVLSAFLFSLYLSLLAIKSEKYRIPLFIASYFFAFVNLITMEYFYFLEFARLIIFYQFLSGDIKPRFISTVKLFLPYFIIFLGVTIWRAFFFTFQNASYVGGAFAWSLRFPTTQYPEAKIRFNLNNIEIGSNPRITLWEYYYIKQDAGLFGRTVFYDWAFDYDNIDLDTLPEPLVGTMLTNRVLQIESSQNYIKIQKLIGGK